MSLKNIIITSSINSLATQLYGQKTYIASTDEQSFPIEEITGSYAGTWPNFKLRNLLSSQSASNTTVDLIVNITQSWPDSNITPLGLVSFTHDTMEEFVNGEFSGSGILVSDGNLTDPDCQQFLEVSTQPVEYSIFPYVTEFNINSQTITYDSFPEFFHRYTVPGPGQILIYVYQTADTSSPPTDYTRTITYAKVARIDQLGNDNTFSLQELTSLKWTDSNINTGEIVLTVTNITEYQNYYLYEVTSDTFSSTSDVFIDDDNVLDYSLEATSSYNGSLNVGYNYLTSSWATIIDTADGFNTSSGHYVFPLTPNCDIQFTASIDITITTSSSFSIAINAYDPIYPHTVSNIVGSIPSPLISSNNTFILTDNSITHSITISGSSLSPIQTYQYEVNAWIEGTGDASINNSINNTFYTTPDNNSNGAPYNQNLPTASYGAATTRWVSIIQDGIYSPSATYNVGGVGWNSYYNIETSPTPSSGVVLVPDIIYTTSGSILSLEFSGVDRPWGNSIPFLLKIEIPSSYSSSANNNLVYGPPLLDLTCSINPITDIENASGFIGYIPANTPGSFYFPLTFISAFTIHIIAPSGSGTWNGTFYGDGYFPKINSISLLTVNTASIHGLSFNITQSQSPQTSTSSIILEPYLYSNFYYSDCDVLINNFSQNDISNIVQEVLYDAGSVIPSNLEQIIDGIAQRAEVNDYLYNAHANVFPRYNGVRTTSPGFNLPSQNGLSNEELSEIPNSSALIINNGIPNVENTTTYFAYFSSLQSNNPIFKNTTAPVIKYLIGEDGTTYSPSADNATYYNIINSFPRDSKVYCNLLYQTSPVFNSTQSIVLSGESYIPVLYTIDTYGNNDVAWTNEIEFTNLQGSNLNGPDYSSYLINNDGAPNSNVYPYTTRNVWYSTQISQPRVGINYSEGGTIETTGPSANFQQVYFEFTGIPTNFVDIEFGGSFYDDPSGARTWYLDLYLNRGGNITRLDRRIGDTGGFAPYQIGFISNFLPQTGDKLWVTITNTGGTIMYKRPAYGPGPYLQITTKNLSVPSASATFWFTGSNSLSVLTSSTELGRALTINNKQIDIPDSGLNPIQVPCLPQVGDEIRFEYDEANTYKIINVNPTSSGVNRITYLTLDQPIPPSGSGFDINHFLIRRKIKDAITGISLGADLSGLPVEDGFILPEYPSETIKNNISNIIQDLINKSVI